MKELLKKISPVELTDEKAEKLAKICELLLEKNKVMNLTSIKTPEEAAERHFADSLYVLTSEKVSGRVLDVGSGGGFPAFPVATVGGFETVCLDATKKKLDFIEETAKVADVSNIKTLYGRAEELGADAKYREKFDTVLSRGVAKLNILCEWCIPFVKKGGVFMAMKGESAEEELSEAENAVKTLGGKTEEVIKYTLPSCAQSHALIIIRKISDTPKEYPRRNTVILKKPL